MRQRLDRHDALQRDGRGGEQVQRAVLEIQREQAVQRQEAGQQRADPQDAGRDQGQGAGSGGRRPAGPAPPGSGRTQPQPEAAAGAQGQPQVAGSSAITEGLVKALPAGGGGAVGGRSSTRASGRPRSMWVAISAAPPAPDARARPRRTARPRPRPATRWVRPAARGPAGDQKPRQPQPALLPGRQVLRLPVGQIGGSSRPSPRRSRVAVDRAPRIPGSRPPSAPPSARRHGRHRRWPRAGRRHAPESAGCSPASVRRRVVLPQPLGPRRTSAAPGARANPTPSRIGTPPRATVRSVTVRSMRGV
jgi:hypothetical protein